MKPLDSNNRKQVSTGVSIPCGFGGWNLRDPVADMPANDALTIDNFFAEPGRIRLRNGFVVQSTGLGTGPVEGLFEFANGTTRKLIGCANLGIYDCSSIGAATLLYNTSITSNRWQGVNFGSRLLTFNGADAPLSYDGTTVTTAGWTGPATVSNLISATVYRSRVYAVEKGTQKVWYGGVAAITGAMTAFDLSQVTLRGGQIQFCHVWTRDTGTGSQEFFVIVMDTGEVMVYQGAYPGDAATWGIVARFFCGAPLSRRSFVNFGAELLLLTQDGLVVFSDLLSVGTATPASKVSDKIGRAISDMLDNYGAPFGWEAFYYPHGNMLMINSPVSANTTQYQFVMNTLNNAWCRFLGMNANTWSLFNNSPYFGGNDGKVYKADSGYSDNGTNITADLQTAFNYYGSRGQIKRFNLIRPVMVSDGTVSPAIEIDVDFNSSVPTAVPTSSASSGAVWDVAPWDTSDWGGSPQLIRNWTAVFGIGYCGSVRMRAVTNSVQIIVQSFDLIFERGGYL